MSNTTMRPAPSPNGTNKEGLYVRNVLVRKDQMLALDEYGGSNSRRQPVGKLARALKMRYGSPKRVLQKLGLDTSLLNPNNIDDDIDDNESEHMLLRHHGMSRDDIQRLIDGHAAKSDSRGGTGGEIEGGVEREGEDDDHDPPIVHPSPRQNEGDRRRVSYDDFRDYLTDRGFSDDEIVDAMKHARDHVRRRADDKRRRVGRDVLPRNASGASKHGGGFGGHLSGGRDSEAINGIRENVERIEPAFSTAVGPDTGRNAIVDHGLDRRHAMDGMPTERQRARTLGRYPHLARIGDVNGNNYTHITPADVRSSAEKKFGLARIGRA